MTAFVAGMGGGWVSQFVRYAPASGPRYEAIRATRIELVDEFGRTRAYLGSDTEKEPALVFLDAKNRTRAAVGFQYGSPTLVMRGLDGAERFRLRLLGFEEGPSISMRDHARERIHLGPYENDVPSPNDKWGITFTGPDGKAVYGGRQPRIDEPETR